MGLYESKAFAEEQACREMPGTALTMRLESILERMLRIESRTNSYENVLGEYTLGQADTMAGGVSNVNESVPKRFTVSQYLERIESTVRRISNTQDNLDNIIL